MSINQVIYNLKKIRNSIPIVERDTAILSANSITQKANENIDDRLTFPIGFFETRIREWQPNISIFGTSIKCSMRNMFENSASVEFGIGLVGSSNPHKIASDVGYIYNMPSESKGNLGEWTFRDNATNFLFFDFLGYEGKSFLWDSLIEFKQKDGVVNTFSWVFNKKMLEIGLVKK